ncbi:MAG TPA: hypothetical protein VIV12_07080 [Streptosporangiaceae bacterium]
MTVRARVARRFERAVLGAVMSMIAFIIERRVLKAIRGTGGEPLQTARRGRVRPAPGG